MFYFVPFQKKKKKIFENFEPQNYDLKKNATDFKSSKLSSAKPIISGPATTRAPAISYVCQPNDFKCVSHPHTCVRANMVCDGIYDCTDHSDEFNCIAGKGSGKSESNSGSGSFKRWKKSPEQGRRSLAKSVKNRKLRKRSFGWSQCFVSILTAKAFSHFIPWYRCLILNCTYLSPSPPTPSFTYIRSHPIFYP